MPIANVCITRTQSVGLLNNPHSKCYSLGVPLLPKLVTLEKTNRPHEKEHRNGIKSIRYETVSKRSIR